MLIHVEEKRKNIELYYYSIEKGQMC